MIRDEMLSQAAAKAAALINESLPEASACNHSFSAKFDRKMSRIIGRAKHPILYRTLRSVASIFLVMMLGFGSVLAIDADAREIVFGWVRKQYESFYEYFFEGKANAEKSSKYNPGWIPEEYSIETSYEIPDGEVYVYTDKRETIIQFTYTASTEGTALFVDTVDYEQKNVMVNRSVATVYLALNDAETNAIIWTDVEEETLFYISAPLGEEDLIKMAENIVEKK